MKALRLRTSTSHQGRPIVLFFDENPWEAFVRLAAVLRRNGVVTIRVTTTQPRRSARGLDLVFTHTVWASPGTDVAARLAPLVAGGVIVNIQTTEVAAGIAYAYGCSLSAPHHVQRWAARRPVVDKLAIACALAAAGVRVPATVPLADLAPAEVADRWGFPVVVKARSGNGGGGVAIAESLAELESCVAEFDPATSFYEQFITGEQYSYGCLSTDEGINAATTYRVAEPVSPHGPHAAIACVDESDIDEIGAAVVKATGVRGLINLNLIADADGLFWVHDVNPRVWGTAGALGEAGVDFFSAYVAWLRSPDCPTSIQSRHHRSPGSTCIPARPGSGRPAAERPWPGCGARPGATAPATPWPKVYAKASRSRAECGLEVLPGKWRRLPATRANHVKQVGLGELATPFEDGPAHDLAQIGAAGAISTQWRPGRDRTGRARAGSGPGSARGSLRSAARPR